MTQNGHSQHLKSISEKRPHFFLSYTYIVMGHFVVWRCFFNAQKKNEERMSPGNTTIGNHKFSDMREKRVFTLVCLSHTVFVWRVGILCAIAMLWCGASARNKWHSETATIMTIIHSFYFDTLTPKPINWWSFIGFDLFERLNTNWDQRYIVLLWGSVWPFGTQFNLNRKWKQISILRSKYVGKGVTKIDIKL